jgi:hypothetical protein
MHQLPDFPLPIRYRPSVLAILAELGAMPRPTTQPRVVYSFLRALFTFEIRERKARRRELERFFGPQPLSDYVRQIEELRAKYALLRVLPREWIVP